MRNWIQSILLKSYRCLRQLPSNEKKTMCHCHYILFAKEFCSSFHKSSFFLFLDDSLDEMSFRRNFF